MSTENTKPQPQPVNADDRAVWPLVIADVENLHEHREGLRAAVLEDMQARDSEGRSKYGVPLVASNGRDHAVDAYQEALDGSAYWRAEYEKTGSTTALNLYHDALNHAWNCRAYLLERDGR